MLVIPLVVTLALAPTDTAARFDLFATAQVGTARVDTPPAVTAPSGDSVSGQAGVALNLYVQRIVDDWTPRSLQPFLQSAAVIFLDGGGGGSRFTFDGPVFGNVTPTVTPQSPETQARAYADVGVYGYPLGFLYTSASIGVRWFDWHDAVGRDLSSGLALPLNFRFGGRLADWRPWIGWGFTPTQVATSTFNVPFWGGVSAGVDGVIRKRLMIDAQVTAQDGWGFSPYVSAELYFLRRFGVSADAFGGVSNANMQQTTHWAGFGVGFDAWLSAHVETSVGYQFEWTERIGPANETDWANLVTLAFRYRR